MTKWVYEGGTFIGVDEPSAVEGYDSYFRMAPVLGVDKDIIDRVCHGQWSFEVDEKAAAEVMPQGSEVSESCLLYTSPSPRDGLLSRMPSSA